MSFPPSEEATLLAALRAGDEGAFETLLDTHHQPLLRLARLFTRDERLAEEAVQETWLAVAKGLERFEGRSSLRTWLFSILMNRARTLARRESRYILTDFSGEPDPEADQPSVAAERFAASGEWAGYWNEYPPAWENQPEASALSTELQDVIEAGLAALPPRQRAVMTLRDMEHWQAAEVCNILNLSESNQRVLLHRARAAVRQRLEDYYKERE